MAEVDNIWDQKSIWDDDNSEELKDDDVIINNPETPDVQEDTDEDEDWYLDLINQSDPEDENITKLKSDPYLSSWVPATVTKNTKVSDNAKYAYNYLSNKGLDSHVAAGIVGNLMKESGVNPGTQDGDNRGGIGGIAQWDPNRSRNLRNFSNQRQSSPYDLDTQLDFVLHEADQRGDLEKTKQARTPEEAAVIFGRSYERPSEKSADWNTRQAYARSLTQKRYGGYGVNNLPEDVLDQIKYEYPQQQEVPYEPITPILDVQATDVTPNTPQKTLEGENSIASNVSTVIDTVNDGIDKFKNYREKVARISDSVSKSTSEAIDFANDIAGNQRDVLTRRKFNAQKNTKSYNINNTNLNQPLIYT